MTNQPISGANQIATDVNVDDLELGYIKRDGKKRIQILVECQIKTSPDCRGRRFVAKTGVLQGNYQKCKPCHILAQSKINGGFFRG